MNPREPEHDDAIAQKNQETIQAVLQKLVDDGAVPGIGAIVSVNGKRISAYAGYADVEEKIPMSEHSRFEISCLMKFFVSLVALSLAEEGKLDLDAPIGDYLPELRAKAPGKANSILVKHLMSHTSGYRGLNIMDAAVKWGMTWPKFVDFFARTEQLFQPGTVFNYEHSEHVILGEILHRVTGVPAGDCVRRKILEPLSVSAGCAGKDKSVPKTWVAGYLPTAKPREFARIHEAAFCPFWTSSLPDATLTLDGIASIAESVYEEIPTTSTTSRRLEEIQKPLIAIEQYVSCDKREHLPLSFGSCCAQFDNGAIGQNGSMSGQTCAFRILPAQRTSVVVGTNTWVPHIRDSVAAWLLSAALTAKKNVTAVPKTLTTLKEFCGGFAPQELVGTYLGGTNGEVYITFDGRNICGGIHTVQGPRALFVLQTDKSPPVLQTAFPIPIIFFPNPKNPSVPCVRMGLYAYCAIH